MYKGRYKTSERKTRKRIPALLISLVLLATVTAGGALAYLADRSAAVTNTFQPGNVSIEIEEDKGDHSKSNIRFQNTGTVPVYIRATLVIYWKDNNGNIVPQPVGGSISGGAIQQGWTEWPANSGIYYYNGQVAPKNWTSVMLSEIGVTYPDGYICHIEVHAEAIQADGLGAGSAQEAWANAKANG